MKLFVTVLFLTVVRSGFAFTDEELCADCEYSNGLGYVSGDNCHQFRQCIIRVDGSIGQTLLCCPGHLTWDQDLLSCDDTFYCNASRDGCPDVVTVTEGPCPLEAVPGEGNEIYFTFVNTNINQTCAVGTIFNQSACACVAGGDRTCHSDPIFYVPFDDSFDDIQCHKVKGTPHGNIKLKNGYIQLDGDGDYLSFGFFNNWFAGNQPDHFLVHVWFNQSSEGFYNYRNFPEGVLANGECDQSSAFWIVTSNNTAQGGVRTDNDEAIFGYNNLYGDLIDRDYFEPNVWCSFDLRVSPTNVSFFINGYFTGLRPINGRLRNSQADFTLGLAYLECLPFFWTGCLDELMVFDRWVSDEEIEYLFGYRQRPSIGGNVPYISPYLNN